MASSPPEGLTVEFLDDPPGVRLFSLSSNFIVVDDFQPCWDCGEPTCFIEINFEAFLHPGACEARKDTEFWAALRAAGPMTPWD